MRTPIAITGVLLLAAVSCFSQGLTCPDPKNKVHEPYCSFVASQPDTAVLTIAVYLPIKSEPDPNKTDTVYWNNLTTWSNHLFTTYDLRDYYVPSQRVPPPADTAVDWVYHLLKATKKTIVDMRDEAYITTISHDSPNPVSSKLDPNPGIKKNTRSSAHVDAAGRAMKGHATRTPKALFPTR